MLFQVSYERFLEEIRAEKITEQDKNKLEIEEMEDVLAYYLSSLDRNKSFVFVVGKDEITDVQKFQLNPISKPSKRITDSDELKNISKKLTQIEEQLNKLPIREKIIEREIIKEE